jgi:hypothetical protein
LKGIHPRTLPARIGLIYFPRRSFMPYGRRQTEKSGLVIVLDGMKIIKIQRQDNPNVIYYVIVS